MKRTLRSFVVGVVLLVGTVAVAGSLALITDTFLGVTKEQRVDKTGGSFPTWFNNGIYVGPNSPNPTNDVLNKVTRILGTTCVADLKTIDYKYTGKNAEAPCTLTGARIGDSCMPPAPFNCAPADGGSCFYGQGVIYQANVKATDTIEIDVTNLLGDGGSLDLPDASYAIECFSNH